MKAIFLVLFILVCSIVVLFTSYVRANPIIQISVSEDDGPPSISPVSLTGDIVFIPTEPDFLSILVRTVGVPIVNSPNLITTVLATGADESIFNGDHSLQVDVIQQNLSPVNADMTTTFAIQNFAGFDQFAGPTFLFDSTDFNPLHFAPFSANQISFDIQGPTFVPDITSVQQDFLVFFTQPGQAITDTIQTAGTEVIRINEPSSFVLLFTLVSLFLLLWRRNLIKAA